MVTSAHRGIRDKRGWEGLGVFPRTFTQLTNITLSAWGITDKHSRFHPLSSSFSIAP